MLVTKADTEELMIAYGAVYTPGVPDAHGEFATAEEIHKMAHSFTADGRTKMVDVMHDNQLYGCSIVESFITRKGDPDFPVEGTWVAAVQCTPEIWSDVKAGKLNGFSLQAWTRKQEVEVEIDLPAVICGRTFKADENEHEHEFEVVYDADGNFLGGRTNAVLDSNGKMHFHEIKRGTATGIAENHSHRFAHVDGLVSRGAA